MALLPNFPISGDDYTVGTITTVAGSKDFKTKDAYLQSYGAVQAGDHIYIAAAAKFLIIGSITGENSGTLTDPCPDDCAVTDADLRIIFKTASSRLQGRTAMLLERLSKGCLASLAELTPKEGQIFRGTSVEGQLEAVDNTADNVIETDNRKFMTAKDRQSIDNVVKRVDGLTTDNVIETDDRKFMTAAERNKISDIDNRLDGLTTDNVPETPEHKYFPADFNADSLAETPNHKVMTADERVKLASINDNYLPITEKEKINKTINDMYNASVNACVTNSRVDGWVEYVTTTYTWMHLTSGYFVTSLYQTNSQILRFGGRQPQLYIKDIGWFPLGAW